MTQPSPEVELHYRLAAALGAHDVHPEQRAEIQQAYLEAGGDEATWDDLPPDIQAQIEQIEQSPRQSWDDPADVPDHIFNGEEADVAKVDQAGPHHADRTDHNRQPDYTPADVGVDALSTVDLDPAQVHVDHDYQRPLDPDRVDAYLNEPRAELAARWGLLAQRPDGSYWVVNGQHHTRAAVDAGIPQLHYQVFQSTGPNQEAEVSAAWEHWHDQHKHAGQA